ncbi:putative 14 protein in nqo3 5'region [Nymphon striatum]|nr:putative 14 protein in nqo3 5'region [Nymphon striatum]
MALDGDLLDIYAGNEGVKVHKWHHYLPLYDRYFGQYRNTPVKFLEIGVNNGGSLQMWRRYLGPDAVLCGIDINPDCAQYDGQSGMVRIGSQDDPEFLAEVVKEMGGVDVVLDDGRTKPHVGQGQDRPKHMRTRHMRFLVAAFLSASLIAVPAMAKPPLREVAAIDDALFDLGLADIIRKNCPTIGARMFKAIGYVRALEKKAQSMGYSKAEIEAYTDSDVEKNRLRAKAATFFSDPQSYCVLGQQEIQNSSRIGSLLRAK